MAPPASSSFAFKSVFKALRGAFKPGVYEQVPSAGSIKSFQVVQDNQNGDPVCDQYGSQWVRDGSLPSPFRDESNLFSRNEGVAFKQLWEIATATDFLAIAQGGGGGEPCALYQLDVVFGDPAVPWATSPYYVQLFTPNNGVAPTPGAIPDWSMPVAREGSSYKFGARTPFNGVSGLGGGIGIAFSVTPNVYTNPGGVLGVINANWALYSYDV